MCVNYLYNKGANYCFAITLFILLLTGTEAWAQKTSVSGTVSDQSGVTIPGATVTEKGTSNAIMTDVDGKFSIEVASPKSELVFSFIGYETITQAAGSGKQLNIIMKESASQLDEVVVIGYGTARKQDLTGAVATVSGDDLKKLTMPSVAETLTGRVAGVQVSSTEGSPDADIRIKIRGGTSLSQDSSPLIIVDGFPVNAIGDISPSDIDKITILKDASSTAIYGSRGANGVIIITTKSGTKDNKISVNYNAFFGAKFLAKTIDVLSPQDYADWQYEYALLSEDQPSYDDVFGPRTSNNQFAGVKGTNWQKEIYGNMGEVQNHDLGVRGGSDKLNYSFTYTRYDEKAIMIGSNFKRNNLSFNLKNKASDKVSLSFTARYSDTEINGGGANDLREFSAADSRLRHSVGYAPIELPGLTTDNTDESVAGYLVHPFVAVNDNQRLQKRRNINLLGGITWEIVKNLQLKSDFGLDNYYYNTYRFYGRSTYYVNNMPLADYQGDPALITDTRQDRRFRNATTLNYDFKKILGDDHHLTLMAGEEIINYGTATVTNTMHGYPKLFDFTSSMNLPSRAERSYVENFVSPDDKLLSFFGRANYDFKNKYLLTATFRADGSSKYLGDNRWGYFPSAAAAWKISEDFLKNVSWVDLVKLRVSYGQAGNNNIPTGQTIQTFQAYNSTWINNVTGYLSPSTVMANPELKWETTITRNLGVDFEFLKGRLSGTLEAYQNTTKDLLLNFPISGSAYLTQYRNMGENENKGFEASLNYTAVNTKDYGLDFSFNIGFNKNTIKSLGVMDNFTFPTNWASTQIGNDYAVWRGQALGMMYGYQNAGRYEVSDFDYVNGVYTLKAGVADASPVYGTAVTPGSMKLKDTNGDGVVNTDDLSLIGNANPKHTGGFVLNANAYGFDLMAAFNWSYGNDIYNANKIEFTTSNPNNQYRNLSTEMAAGNRWTNIDASGQLVTDPTALAALNANTSMWSPYMNRYVFNDWAVEDGSFLRLNTLTLGYTLPDNFNKTVGISKLRFYATCNNVFVITNYSGLDPEVSTKRSTPYTPGVDSSAYPRSRQFTFGLNLNF
ncbi:SusC/RagA family TonB-linked outer membrane protein [Flavobacterium sp. Sd200]|uniref:SusC/RagA family TonB-linked outer membrane protein n=1 Tax=Flavobacterium sp. Sd200 TaxID=2692211 RepID=UPI001370BC51|nr:TonB-dependent receptor [Flavobacterium sp. Sd200]MXN92527.1 SusC/RagA family TonB-linked outer membrane protein [Flavobacterium sp. Sd200]